MSHTVLANMHLQCDECGTVRNEPFCPVCIVPRLKDDFYAVRFDGVDGLDLLAKVQGDRDARKLFKNGDERDLVAIFGGA